jgi:hypothetical protein
VQKLPLRRMIIDFASVAADPASVATRQFEAWERSVHISGCKGSGKTNLLCLIGEDLVRAGHQVFFIDSAKRLDLVEDELRKLDGALQRRAFVLVDESQNNLQASAFTFLLKQSQSLVTIAAGVPPWEAESGQFALKLHTDVLFLKKDELQSEGVVDYFVGATPGQSAEVVRLLEFLQLETGGQIYPLLRLSELLVKLIMEGKTAMDCFDHYNSAAFRTSTEFRCMCSRIVPSVLNDDVHELFQRHPKSIAIRRLSRSGFCTQSGMILSRLLVQAHIADLSAVNSPNLDVAAGLKGVTQLLEWALSAVRWDSYDTHGDAVEDALTFELAVVLKKYSALVVLFQPKLQETGHSARRPDLFINSHVNTYVEAVLCSTRGRPDVKRLEQHIKDFLPLDGKEAYYPLVAGRDWAILNYQKLAGEPMKPRGSLRRVFEERVFTFVMPERQLYLGSSKVLSNLHVGPARANNPIKPTPASTAPPRRGFSSGHSSRHRTLWQRALPRPAGPRAIQRSLLVSRLRLGIRFLF